MNGDRRGIRLAVALLALLLVHASTGARAVSRTVGRGDTLLLAVGAAHGLGAAALAGSSLALGLSALGATRRRMARSALLVRGAWTALACLLSLAAAAGLLWPLELDAIAAMLRDHPIYRRAVDESGGSVRISYAYILLNNFGSSSLAFALPGLVLYLAARLLVRLRPPGPRRALAVLWAGALATPLLSMSLNGYLVGSVLVGDERIAFPRTALLLAPHGVLELPAVSLLAAVAVSLWGSLFRPLVLPGAPGPPPSRLAPAWLLSLVLLLAAAVVEAEATTFIFLLLG